MKRLLIIGSLMFFACTKNNHQTATGNNSGIITGNDSVIGWYSMAFSDGSGTFNFIDSIIFHANYYATIDFPADTMAYVQGQPFEDFYVNFVDSSLDAYVWGPNGLNGMLQVSQSNTSPYRFIWLNVSPEPSGYGSYYCNINPTAGDTFTITGNSTTGKIDIKGGRSYYLRVSWQNIK